MVCVDVVFNTLTQHVWWIYLCMLRNENTHFCVCAPKPCPEIDLVIITDYKLNDSQTELRWSINNCEQLSLPKISPAILKNYTNTQSLQSWQVSSEDPRNKKHTFLSQQPDGRISYGVTCTETKTHTHIHTCDVEQNFAMLTGFCAYAAKKNISMHRQRHNSGFINTILQTLTNRTALNWVVELLHFQNTRNTTGTSAWCAPSGHDHRNNRHTTDVKQI